MHEKSSSGDVPQSEIERWRNKTPEELFDKYLSHIQSRNDYPYLGYKFAFQERRLAARILARKQFLPAGEVLLKWLKNPSLGIGQYCYGYENSGSNTWPEDYLYADDASDDQIQELAAESLGLMRYEPAREDLQGMLGKCFTTIQQESASIKSWEQSRNIERQRRFTPILEKAIARFDNPNLPEDDIETDKNLYAMVYRRIP